MLGFRLEAREILGYVIDFRVARLRSTGASWGILLHPNKQFFSSRGPCERVLAFKISVRKNPYFQYQISNHISILPKKKPAFFAALQGTVHDTFEGRCLILAVDLQ